MWEPILSRTPLLAAAGNHEMESQSNGDSFASWNARFPQPQDKGAIRTASNNFFKADQVRHTIRIHYVVRCRAPGRPPARDSWIDHLSLGLEGGSATRAAGVCACERPQRRTGGSTACAGGRKATCGGRFADVGVREANLLFISPPHRQRFNNMYASANIPGVAHVIALSR